MPTPSRRRPFIGTIIVSTLTLAGCQTVQLAEELPKPPVLERVDGRSVSESAELSELARRDMGACNAEALSRDRAGTLPISTELRMALLKDFSQAKAYAAYERAKIEVYVACMERRGYRRSDRAATLH